MRRLVLASLFVLFASLLTLAADAGPLLLQGPTLSKTQIAFAFGGDICLLPDRTTVARGSAESGSRTRLILHNGKIVGVDIVNRISELGTIVKLIENRVDVSAKQNELADPEFDLRQIFSSP